MAYQVLARKWRPQRFAEVVGQEHITRTLQNAIAQARVGHAYLFVGPRGIGKTTTARIFAKALNCETGLVPEPCCNCQSCREIADGTSLDVIEIDGASHNRVEHIRDIRDNVQYTPSRSRDKIYIIDEVHMLTSAAWNALLKTLEEPPPHVKFLFATTEPHKVLPTIVSRCQRFDLKRIPVPLIMERLKQIADTENISIEERALAAIARAADGGMRDGQSIFDQMIAFCGGGTKEEMIREQDVIDVFGLASGAELRELAGGLLQNRLGDVLTIVQDLADRGRDLERLYADLVHYIRNIMILCVCPEPDRLLEVSGSELADLKDVAGAGNPGTVQRILHGLVAQEWTFRSALNKRVYLEATLARIIQDAHSVQIDDVIARLNELKQDDPGPTPPQPPKAGTANADRQRDGGNADGGAEIRKGAENGIPSGPTQGTGRSAPRPGRQKKNPGQTQAPTPVADTAAGQTQSRPPPGPAGPPRTRPGPRENDVAEAPAPADRNGDGETTAADPNALWHHLIQAVARTPGKSQLKHYMQECKPVSYRDGILHVAYDEDVPREHPKILLEPENQQLLQTCLNRIAPAAAGKVLIKRWIDAVSNEHITERLTSSPEVRRQMEQNTFVRDVCDLFGGTVVDVRG